MTTLLSFTPDGFQHAWDATSLSSFAKCPRYYQLKHIEGWAGNFTSVHLVFGGIYAASLERYFKLVAEGATPSEALRQIIRLALIETWTHERDEAGERILETGSPWDSEHNLKTRDTLIRSIVWYFDHFASDTMDTVHLADNRPAVELSFSIPFGELDDIELTYCGHIDRLVEYSGGKYVMDQKTSGSTISSKFFRDFTPDMQMSGYTWAGKQLFDIPISGVVIDAAQIAVGFTRFERGFVHRSEAMLAEWYDTAHSIIEEAYHAFETSNYRMNPTACGNYGGCEFRNICSRHPDHRPALLSQDFHRKERWDPLRRR